MKKAYLLRASLMLLLLCGLTSNLRAASYQEKGFQSTDPIRRNQEFTVTFHRPILTAENKVVWISDADTAVVGPALSAQEIEQGFRVGELIAIRITAPMDCFVYGVNNSQWDGATLVENGMKLQANKPRDFVYKLSNRQGKQGIGRENLFFLIRSKEIPQEEVVKYLLPPVAGANAASPRIQLGGTPKDREAAEKTLTPGKSTKGGKGPIFWKIGCGVASIFVPFAGRICDAVMNMKSAGFSATDPVRRGQSEAIAGTRYQLKPEKDAENIAIQVSFNVKP